MGFQKNIKLLQSDNQNSSYRSSKYNIGQCLLCVLYYTLCVVYTIYVHILTSSDSPKLLYRGSSLTSFRAFLQDIVRDIYANQ